MYELIATIFKYIFTLIIYVFIFSIIRMIYLDIRSMKGYSKKGIEAYPYLKLINRREKFDFKLFESYILDEDKSIGRSNRNEISIQDPYLSSEHVRIYIEEDICLIKDLGSTNGTFLNDEQIEEESVVLNDGDRIHIGQLDFIFVSKDEEE
ncbi:FHA domain-containing protein [Alkalibaculum sp. M08DMB]|uniref:FHA domain-containing protein n=1 Tax=Alkalibaculum sporogenes TaxID=2655001 RepID=A0A6A7K6V5_9FIRM|nr:FHA domain-containing protein [Alkalibaculum sporogenes]MPW25144.1 FHA domain-containing protein [Alkalibaculum sporogenes]